MLAGGAARGKFQLTRTHDRLLVRLDPKMTTSLVVLGLFPTPPKHELFIAFKFSNPLLLNLMFY